VKQVFVAAVLLLVSACSSFALSAPHEETLQPGPLPPSTWDRGTQGTANGPEPSSLRDTARGATREVAEGETAQPYACPLELEKPYAIPLASGTSANRIAVKECTGVMP